MSLKTVALFNTGEEDIVVTYPNGASELELVSSPVTPAGGLQLLFADDGNAQMRRTLTFRSKLSSYDAKAKTWSKGRREITFSEPIEVSTGVFQSLTARLIVEIPATVETNAIYTAVSNVVQVAKAAAAEQFLVIGTLD